MGEITKEVLEISEEQKAITEEVEEIQQDNKELMEILKSKPFKRGKRLIDYFFMQLKKFFEENKNVFQIPTGPEETKTTTKKEEIEFIDFVIYKDYSEKAYKLWNKDALICYIPKSCTEKIEDNRLHLNASAKKWFIPEWKEDK